MALERRGEAVVKRNATVLTASRVVASAAQALSLILLARLVSPAEFGSLSAMIAVGTFLVAVLDFGTSPYVLKLRARSRDDPRIATSVFISRIGTGLSAALLVLTWLTGALGDVSTLVAALIVAWVTFERLAEMSSAILLADGRIVWSASCLVLRRLLPLLLFVGVTAIAPNDEPAVAFAASLTAGAGAAVCVNALLLRHQIAWRVRAPVATVLRESRHYLSALGSSQARNLEVPLIQAFADAHTGGLASLALRFGQPARLVATSVAQTVLPRISTQVHEARSTLTQIVILGVAGTLAGAFAAAFLPALIPALVGSDYAGAILPTQIVVTTAALTSLSAPLGSLLQALDQERAVGVNGVVFAIAGIVATIVGAVLGDLTLSISLISACFIGKTLSLFVMGIRHAPPEQ
ncbi:lipopolysaccharide biosynthesis protein [Protaetiibacter intestinalis]|uniref:Lipopolysaccharide biosynthesis protein n=1 Tax=Protaetiibacter intestinalis TaxID=2419774 RepID=A0A387B158_9MICO|nr:oligosaccharide flippase family protein [Protaetiibacter intestinalis]AYF97242.1 hypothetical protein D7I47_02580 [Protaetiibacter intestinalis]